MRWSTSSSLVLVQAMLALRPIRMNGSPVMYMPPASYPGACRYSSPSTLGLPNPSCGAPHSSAWPLAERDGDTATALEPPCDSTRMVMPVLRIVFRSADSAAAALARSARLIAGKRAAACSSELSARADVAPADACSAGPGTVVGAVGSLIQRESLKIAAAAVNGFLA